jgi:hypothetical protein
LLLAPVQEATEARSELEEALIIAVGKLKAHIYIVTR